MYATIHEEMLDNIEHLDNDTQGKVVLAYVRYQLYGELPDSSDVLVYSIFMAKKFDLDSIIARATAQRNNGALGGAPVGNSNARKTWDIVLKQPKSTQVQPKSTQNNHEKEKEKENKNIYPPDFESFWKEFPHARKGKKGDSYAYYSHLDSSAVLLEARHLKLMVMAGVQDSQFIPACERWLRDFTPTSEVVKVQDLERIMRWHLTTEGAKERYPLLVSVYGETRVKAMAKKLNSVLDLDGPKNVQV